MKILAIAESGSVSQASRALGIAQPALSKTVSNLEDYLKIKIFERGHAGVRPTREGEVLLARARAIQGELHRVERDVLAMQAHQANRVVIGVVPIHPLDQQTRAIVAVMAEYPELDFGVEPDSMDGLLKRLAAGSIDFIFAPLPEQPVGIGYIEEPIYWEQLVVACGPASPLFTMKSPTPAMILDQPWTIGETGTVSHGRLVEFCRAHRQALPRIKLQVDVVPARRAAIEHSDMLSIFQYSQVYTPSKNGNLRALPIRWPHVRRAIGTIRSSSTPGGVHDTFAAKMREVFSVEGMEVIS
jgi:DNA-binding transcriptional LysR family regulator